MDAKMYGAYWCSHCFDQKEVFGKQVFNKDESSKFNIEYVECAKDGSNSQTKLCKSKEVPGYPTWEIKGKLYPGEQELDELEDLVKSIMAEWNTVEKEWVNLIQTNPYIVSFEYLTLYQ